MMKKLTALLLVLLLAVFAAACAPAGEPVAEPAPEATVSPAAPEAPVLPDPDAAPAEAQGGELDWPEGDAGLRVPEFQGGVIAAVLDNGDNCTVTVTGASAEAYNAYVSELKEAGFTADVNEVTEDSMHMYSAASEDNYYASVAMTDHEVIISAEFLG